MQVIIEQDEITKGISVREQDVTEEFAYAAIACYLSGRIGKDFPEDREAALKRMQQTLLTATEIVKENYKKKPSSK